MNFIKNFFFLCGLGCATTTMGQCVNPQAQGHLQGNAVNAVFRTGGDMFADSNITPNYAVTHNSTQPALTTFFAGSLWFGGYDQGANLIMSAQTYRNNGHDFWPGPLDPSTGTTLPLECNNYDRVWKVSGADVRALIADFNDNGVINNTIHPSLLAWPGDNNPHSLTANGFNLPQQSLAPFFDRNTDGIYDPFDGDYPIADPAHPNVIADDLLWLVYNDNGNLHTQTNGQSAKMEVQLTAYAFNCPNDPLLNTTVFTRHKLINRNVLTLAGFNMGLWLDFDLGCANDDYMGSAPALNSLFVYNGDNDDDVNCGNNQLTVGYGNNPPVQAVTFLNQTMDHSRIYRNQSSSVPAGSGEPYSTLDYYNYLSGGFSSNASVGASSNYDPNNTQHVNYAFPGDPNSTGSWSMQQDGQSAMDYKGIMSIDIGNLLPGAINEVVTAYSYHSAVGNNNLQNVALMYQQLPLIQNFYNNGYQSNNPNTCNVTLSTLPKFPVNASQTLSLYPNPSTDWVTIELNDAAIETVEIYTVLGQQVLHQPVQQLQQVAINTQELPRGVYWVKVHSRGHVWSQRLLVE